MSAHIEKLMPLSEPEGEFSDCSSYEEYSECSSSDSEEIFLTRDREDRNGRRDSTTSSSSTCSNYRSWCQSKRRRCGSLSLKPTDSKDTVITVNRKGFWYWFKLALFVATPFIARQVGIVIGKRIMSSAFKPSSLSVIN